MKQLSAILICVLTLTACGVDGPPTAPTRDDTQVTKKSGISISGSVKTGISKSW